MDLNSEEAAGVDDVILAVPLVQQEVEIIESFGGEESLKTFWKSRGSKVSYLNFRGLDLAEVLEIS